MLQILKQTTKETLDFRLRSIFGVAEEAREQGVFSVANEACAYLLMYALDEDTKAKRVRIDIATTDEYGEARGETAHDLLILTHKASQCKTRIPLRLLAPDPLGRCYRRVGGDFERRAHPRKRSRPLEANEEARRRLLEKFRELVGSDGIKKARSVLKSL